MSTQTEPMTGSIQTHNISPFDAVSEREKKEESRLNVELEKLQREEIAEEKKILEQEKVAEESLREEAMKELQQFKAELGKELASNEKDIAKHIDQIEKTFNESSPKVIEKQAEELLSLGA